MRVERELIEWEPSGFPTVIAFDPGGTTGWSAISVHPDSLVDPDVPILDNIIHWDQGQIEGDEYTQVDIILEMLDLWDGAAAVMEDFQLRTISAELSPERIKTIAGWALSRLFDPTRSLFLQMPSMKETASDDRLKRWDLYRPGEQHARDATRHAIVFLRRAKASGQIREAAFPHLFGEVDTPILST